MLIMFIYTRCKVISLKCQWNNFKDTDMSILGIISINYCWVGTINYFLNRYSYWQLIIFINRRAINLRLSLGKYFLNLTFI